MRKTIQASIAVLVIGVAAYAAEVTQTITAKGLTTEHTFTWLSGTNNMSANGAGTLYVRGQVVRATFVPASGATAPSNTYAVTLKDANGVDVLAGLGTGMATSGVQTVCPGLKVTDGTTTSIVPFAVNSILTMSVTNCGNSRTGTVLLQVR